jgi:hypothetical protein
MRAAFLAATAIVAAGTSACGGTGGTLHGRPTLALVNGADVHGTRFEAHELVRLTFAVAGDRRARRMRSGASGSFLVKLPFRDPCLGDVLVVARGTSGDLARLKLLQRACVPARAG